MTPCLRHLNNNETNLYFAKKGQVYMKCRDFEKIIKDYPEKSNLSKCSIEKLPANVKIYMEHLAGKELSGDCRFENDNIDMCYTDREDADKFVLIAESGTGDMWLLGLLDGVVYFLDHEIWDEPDSLRSMRISFEQFVRCF